MKKQLIGSGLTLILLLTTLAAGADDAMRRTATTLRDRALTDPRAWNIVESLVTEIGPRPVGSPAMARAKEWGLALLKAERLENVHAEEFVKENAWFRGAESADITAPYPHQLAILGLGNSVPTPPEGIEAEISVFSTLNELKAAAPGSLNGRIAVLDSPMPIATQSAEGYRALSLGRRDGPSIAAQRGAVAFLIRSLSTSDSRLPHTGATRYADNVTRIPSAALSVPDAQLIERLVARGKPVKVRLKLASTVTPKTPAWNIIGDLRGRDANAQMIVLGGHLDSWDVSECASDDAAGIAISVAATRLIADLPQRPKRTVRVVMWGSEESYGSGVAFAEQHKAEAAKIALASEADFGTGRVYMVAFSADKWADPAIMDLMSVLAPLGIVPAKDVATFAGSDLDEIQKSGVPVVRLSQDATRYFDIHHSADDTLNKINRDELNQNVAAWAAVLYVAAESGVDFRTPAAPQ